MGCLRGGLGGLRAGLAVVCSMLVALQAGLCLVVLAVAFLPGWQVSAIESGSMAPALGVGDVVLTEKPDVRPPVGSVVLVTRDGELPLLHRITAWSDDGTATTRGDANQLSDSTPVAPSEIAGVGRIALPAIGLPSIWLANGDVVSLGLAAGCELIVFGFARKVGSLPTTNHRIVGMGPSAAHRGVRGPTTGPSARGSRRSVSPNGPEDRTNREDR